MPRCFKIHLKDNVATMLDDAPGGVIEILGADTGRTVKLEEPIKLGHKVALTDIPAGQLVMKFGVAIGVASNAIGAGRWVHLHNCKSQMDERSGTLDNETGAPTDTAYQ
jgi:altronate dehydratase small subunit